MRYVATDVREFTIRVKAPEVRVEFTKLEGIPSEAIAGKEYEVRYEIHVAETYKPIPISWGIENDKSSPGPLRIRYLPPGELEWKTVDVKPGESWVYPASPYSLYDKCARDFGRFFITFLSSGTYKIKVTAGYLTEEGTYAVTEEREFGVTARVVPKALRGVTLSKIGLLVGTIVLGVLAGYGARG